ncbi:hypothetical protein PVAND_000291 [Polypedilum vanderplanki]|uniref:Endonuclease/exonuclease/phosphatase domain-containing protein n=1 Tax=Polypedilum vanderplanki TaxID=319348 RepID=A0A9J6BKH8_POLVA|nr:hypothetical protein PVAND_000291 [Polypedilum vanderplanki]
MISQLIHKPDLIVFGETKLKPRFPANIYNIKGYTKFVECRKSSKKDGGGGGLLVFIRKDIIILSIETLSFGNNIKCSIQKIKLKISLSFETFTIVNYYRPPDYNNSKDFLMDLEREMEASNGKTIFVGDLNINLNASTNLSKKYRALLNCYDFDVTNSFITRNNSNSIIDHTVINFIRESSIANHTIKVRSELSDHNMVITSFANIKIARKHTFKKIYRTDFTQLQASFEDLVSAIQFDDIQDPNEIVNELTKITQDSICKSTKCKIIKVKNEEILGWYNDKVKKAIALKQKLSTKLRKDRENEHLKRALKSASVNLKMVIKEEKRKHDLKLFRSNDSKKMWKNINTVLGRKMKNEPANICIDGFICNDKKLIAETFNNYFIDNVNNLTNKLPNVTYSEIPPKTVISDHV